MRIPAAPNVSTPSRPRQRRRARTRDRLVAALASLALAVGLGTLTAVPASARAACIDLRIASIAASPSNPVANSVVSLRFTVQNRGTCATRPDVFVGLSPGPGLTPNGRTILDQGPGTISEEYVLTTSYPAAGSVTPTLVVDPEDVIAETDETNNSRSVNVSVQPATIDLTITGVTFDPVRPVRGRPMQALVRVRNLGTSTAQPFQVGWAPAWNQNFRTLPAGPLAGGATTVVAFPFTYPTYWNFTSFAEIPVDALVNPEISYTNNAFRFQVPVDPVGPDLVVSGMHLTPSNPLPGQPVQAAFVLQNLGNAAATGFRFQWQPRSGVPLESADVAGLAAGASTTVTFGHTFPSASVYQGTATVDPLLALPEIEDGNNALPTIVPIAPHRTNLKVVTDFEPLEPRPGEPFTAVLTVYNTGDTASGPFDVGFDPATSAQFGGQDQTLTQHVANLERGQTRALRFSYVYLVAGVYDTVATVDAADRVVETAVRDNRFVRPLTVVPPDVDLEVTGFTLRPAQPTRSTATSASVTVKNTGRDAARSFVVQWKLPASSGANPRTTVRGLAPGESRTITFGGTFAVSGPARTSAVVDVFGQVVEPGQEGDNTAVKDVTVLAGGPALSAGPPRQRSASKEVPDPASTPQPSSASEPSPSPRPPR